MPNIFDDWLRQRFSLVSMAMKRCDIITGRYTDFSSSQRDAFRPFRACNDDAGGYIYQEDDLDYIGRRHIDIRRDGITVNTSSAEIYLRRGSDGQIGRALELTFSLNRQSRTTARDEIPAMRLSLRQ